MHFEDLIGDKAPKWPYPVDYNKENEVTADVLILGGGISGCWAAIGAARKGVKVVLVEKGATRTSGAGGSGVDHWHMANTNPACKVTPEEYSQSAIESSGGYRSGISQYIACRESYDCLLEWEKMGVKVRDSEGEFKGARFRDDATGLLFAYDYENKYCVRVWGVNGKQALYKECRRLGVLIYDRVMVTSLLNDGGKQGSRIVGATGINVHTGEFYVFKGKASVLCMYLAHLQWSLSTEIRGMIRLGGDGQAMAWKAGAEVAGAEQSSLGVRPPGRGGAYGYPQYGTGTAANTWYAATLVDAKGTEIPWVDRDGKVLKTVAERYLPAPGQKFFLWNSGRLYDYRGPQLIPDWPERVKKGEYQLPIYADLASMSEHERRVIWGLMIGQEGRSLIPIYWTYGRAGFNPDKDMLQYYEGGWGGIGPPQWRKSDNGSLIIDWNLKTNLDGLYAAGDQIFAFGQDHSHAATTGRYAGRHAAIYAKDATEGIIDRSQVEMEMKRVYAPVYRTGGMDWKELNFGVNKVMQDYCGEIKNEELLNIGLQWLDEIEYGEAQTVYARNPHELVRVLEVFTIITDSKMILEACKARKASNTFLNFKRSDYPETDPHIWNKWVTLKQVEGKIKVGELPLNYYGDLKKNYELHCQL